MRIGRWHLDWGSGRRLAPTAPAAWRCTQAVHPGSAQSRLSSPNHPPRPPTPHSGFPPPPRLVVLLQIAVGQLGGPQLNALQGGRRAKGGDESTAVCVGVCGWWGWCVWVCGGGVGGGGGRLWRMPDLPSRTAHVTHRCPPPQNTDTPALGPPTLRLYRASMSCSSLAPRSWRATDTCASRASSLS